MKARRIRGLRRLIGLIALVTSTLSLYGCESSVGVGLSVGVPVGRYGYMSVGGTRWY